MDAELKHIAHSGDGPRDRLRLKRPLLEPVGAVAKNELVDLGRRKPCDLDRRVGHDQFFELDLQRVEIPSAFFPRRLTASLSTRCSSGLRVSDPNARKRIKPQLLGGVVTGFTVDELIVAADKERNAKAKGGDRRSNVPNMNGIELAELSRGSSSRKHVIAPWAHDSGVNETMLALATKAAPFAQLIVRPA